MGLSIHDQNILIAKERGYKSTKQGDIIGIKGYKLSLRIDKRRGYYLFSISVNSKTKTINVHKFIGFEKFGRVIFEDHIVVRHLDGDPLNNKWDNIDYGTQSDNMMDKPKSLRVKLAKNASSYLKKYDYQKVKEYYNKCKSYKETMKRFDISSKGSLHYIINS